MTYDKHDMVILDGNCDGMGEEYEEWLYDNYPEITVDLRMNVSGVGGGLFDENGNQVENPLWDEFCNYLGNRPEVRQ